MSTPESDDAVERALNMPGEVDDAVEQLCRGATRSLIIRSPRLEFSFLGTTDLLTALTPLITGDRRNLVHILIDDEQHFLKTGNRVVDLARRFGSCVQVRKLPPEYFESPEVFLVADASNCIHQKSANAYPALLARNAPERARELARRFGQMWERGDRIAELHTLGL